MHQSYDGERAPLAAMRSRGRSAQAHGCRRKKGRKPVRPLIPEREEEVPDPALAQCASRPATRMLQLYACRPFGRLSERQAAAGIIRTEA